MRKKYEYLYLYTLYIISIYIIKHNKKVRMYYKSILLHGHDTNCAQTAAWFVLFNKKVWRTCPSANLRSILEYTNMGGKSDRVKSFYTKNMINISWGNTAKIGLPEPMYHIRVKSRNEEENDTTKHYDTQVCMLDINVSEHLFNIASLFDNNADKKHIPLQHDVIKKSELFLDPSFAWTCSTPVNSIFVLDPQTVAYPEIFYLRVNPNAPKQYMFNEDIKHSKHTKTNIGILFESPTLLKNSRKIAKSAHVSKLYTLGRFGKHLGVPNEFYGGFKTWLTTIRECPNPNTFDKTKIVSIIASGKKKLPGHKLRHIVIDSLAKKYSIDCMGKGYYEIKCKEEGHVPYLYSVIIENESHPDYFTEKIIDGCLAGNVVFYWGAPNIGDYFDTGSIITFTNIDELDLLLSSMSQDDWNKRRNAIQNNMYLAWARRTLSGCIALDTSITSQLS